MLSDPLAAGALRVPSRPITDLSPRVVSLAREIDRLPPGEYVIRLSKCDLKTSPWQAEITRSETVRNMEIGK